LYDFDYTVLIGATGITGALMSTGILPATPIAVPFLAGGALLVFGYTAYHIFSLKRRLQTAKEGVEIQFPDTEARDIEAIIRLLSKGHHYMRDFPLPLVR